MKRRNFLGAMLGAFSAPAFVRNPMKVRPSGLLVPAVDEVILPVIDLAAKWLVRGEVGPGKDLHLDNPALITGQFVQTFTRFEADDAAD